jgi:8-oxo-dGTP pyrophosphatase MutT (NUDIX family)
VNKAGLPLKYETLRGSLLPEKDRVRHDPVMDYEAVDLPGLLLETDAAVEMKAHGSREAAVLVPIRNWPADPHLVFTERRADLRKHAGEISFPGGTSEDQDRDLEDTALRESHEEIALHPEHVEVLGALPPIGTFATSFRIQPIVGLVSEEADLIANPDEVAAILTFGIDELVDAYAMRRLVRRGVPIRTPTFELGRHLIWGATARILTDFFHRIGAMR